MLARKILRTARQRPTPVGFLELIAHDLRWRLLGELARSDRRVSELVELVGERPNLVSYHLGLLRHSRVISGRRSSADARDVYYSLELERFRDSLARSAGALHPGLESHHETSVAEGQRKTDKPTERVLFLCTGNSARSQMAEAILRHLSHGLIDVRSAGTRPRGVHPLAVRVIRESFGVDISAQRSKHLDEFMHQKFGYVITLCDRAREECPIFPGGPERIHWSFPDPAEVDGEEARYAAFRRTASELTTRIRFLIAMIERNTASRGESPSSLLKSWRSGRGRVARAAGRAWRRRPSGRGG